MGESERRKEVKETERERDEDLTRGMRKKSGIEELVRRLNGRE